VELPLAERIHSTVALDEKRQTAADAVQPVAAVAGAADSSASASRAASCSGGRGRCHAMVDAGDRLMPRETASWRQWW